MKKIFYTILLMLVLGTVTAWGIVSDDTNRVTFSCNGSTTTFDFTYPITATSDMVVILRTVATGDESVLTEVTHYELSATNNDYSSGGVVTTVETYSSAYTLTLIRNVPETQEADLEDSGVLRLETLEAALNKLTLLIQDLEEELARAIKFPRSDSTALDTELPSSVSRASKNVTTGSDGGITATSQLATGSANISAFGETLIDDATAAAARATLLLMDYTVTLELAGLKTKSPWIDVRVYGADPTGATDSTAAIQAAIDYSITTGRTVFFPPGNYKVTSTITGSGSIFIKGSDATIEPDDDFITFDFDAAASAEATTTVSAEMELGDTTVTLTSVTNVDEGDLLVFTSDVLWYWDNRSTLYKGELHIVKSIAGSVVTLTSPVADSYDIDDSETVTVTVYPKKTACIEDIKISCNANIDSTIMRISYMQNSILSGLELINSDTAGLSVSYCYNTLVDGVLINLDADISDNLGYGCSVNRSTYTKVVNSTFLNCRRGVDFTGTIPSRFGEVSNCIVSHEDQSTENTSGFGTHGTAEHILFSNNIIHGTRIGIYSRGGNISVIGNTFSGEGKYCVYAPYGDNLYIANNFVSSPANRVELTDDLGTFSWWFLLHVHDDFDSGGKITVIGNNASRLQKGFLETEISDVKWTILNNDVAVKSTAAETTVLFLSKACDLTNSKIHGNNYVVLTGTKKWYSGGTTNVAATEMFIVSDGALYTQGSEAAADIEADTSTTIHVNVPSGAKLLGVQLRVDTALVGGETWDAAYSGGSTQAIASGAAVAQYTKVNKFFDENADTAIIGSDVDVAITKNGGGSFTAQGTISAIVYYQAFIALVN